jgi:hypothetical protein
MWIAIWGKNPGKEFVGNTLRQSSEQEGAQFQTGLEYFFTCRE